MSKPTSGKWYVDPKFRRDIQCEGRAIGTMFVPNDRGKQFIVTGTMAAKTDAEAFANTRLMAASKTLLKALRKALDALEVSRPIMSHYEEPRRRHADAISRARAAISEAVAEE